MTTLTQRTFSSGEVSPSLYARVDTIKYATGLRTCSNMMVLRYGGVSNRPGTGFISEVKDSTKSVRLIPFVFSKTQTYVLEFGEYYMRVYRDGVQLTDISGSISNITLGATTTINIPSHGLTTGQEVYIGSVEGTIELNNRNFKVNVIDTSNFEILNMDNTSLDSTSYTAYVSGGEFFRVYEIESPYSAEQAKEFKYIQSADIITFAHPELHPQELLRFGDTNWTFQKLDFSPQSLFPEVITASGGPAGSNTFRYAVTAINEDGVESLAGTTFQSAVSILNVSTSNPGVITTGDPHGLNSGDVVYLSSSFGNIGDLDLKHFIVDPLTSTTFELRNVDTTFMGPFTSGSLNRTFYTITNKGTPTTASPITISWQPDTGAVEFNVYKEVNGTYSLLGVTTADSFEDIGQDVDGSKTLPFARYPFLGPNTYPSTVAYIQQRLAFANSLLDPEKIFLSRTSDFKNFSKSSPSQQDDAITFQMAGRQVNSVQSLLDLGSLIIMTSSGEWSAAGNDAGVITPSSINTKQYSYNGSGELQPIIIDGAAIYQQARGSIVRDLGYDFQVDGYRGNDLTIFSSHLFDKFTLVDWAFQQIPHSILWIVRSDGKLLGMTMVRSQEIRAWHVHDLGGFVESVASIPEGNEDTLYVQVKRNINGKEVRYIEKLASRRINDIKDNKFMDSFLSYDGRNTGSTTMTLSGGALWDHTETLTLTASASVFKANDTGNQIHFTEGNLRVDIVNYVSATEVQVKAKKNVPASLQNQAVTEWAKAVDQLSGLWHIEGKDVSVFADGYVVASPNNSSYVTVTVTNGMVTLDKPYSVIHVGLPYLSDIETLDIDTSNGETISDKEKIVNRVNLFVEDTRGVWTGPKPPSDDTVDPLESLVEMKIRNEEDYDSPVSLKTDIIDVNIEAEWNSNGRVFVRQVDPIPVSILAVSPAGKYPFR